MTQPLIARVKNGRLVLDEPTDLPEGEEVEVHVVRRNDASSSEDGLDDEARAELYRELDGSVDDHDAGRVDAHADVMAELQSRRS